MWRSQGAWENHLVQWLPGEGQRPRLFPMATTIATALLALGILSVAGLAVVGLRALLRGR